MEPSADATAPIKAATTVSQWGDRNLVQALPFFSKVNLRRHADDLRRMGYKVAFKRIDIDEGDA
jgi:hypothetical protein